MDQDVETEPPQEVQPDEEELAGEELKEDESVANIDFDKLIG